MQSKQADERRRPNVLYIGFQKTGSEFLRSYFDFHKEIAWSRHANAFKFTQSRDVHKAYLSLLPRDVEGRCYIDTFEGLATGVRFKQRDLSSEERFTPYLMPSADLFEINVQNTAETIHSLLPEAKIIISIRSQVNWLISNWNHFINRLPNQRRQFTDFLSTFEGKSLLHSGNFDQTIAAFQYRFGRANVFILPLEALSSDLESNLRNICHFIGVDYEPFPTEAANRNQGRDATDLFVRRHISGGLSESTTARKFYSLTKPIIQLLARRLRTNPVSTEQRRLLEAFFSSSNRVTSELTGLNLQSLGYPV